MSPVMKVSLDSISHYDPTTSIPPPQDLVFKVYDRKFAPSLRKYYKSGPATYESEASGLISEERDALFEGIMDDPPELLEHLFAMVVPSYFDNECAAYERLSSLQGKMVPTFYGTTHFLDDSPAPGLDISVQGILLEFVSGVNLCNIDPSQANLSTLIPGAIRIVDVCGDMGLLNKDVRMENFIVKSDGSGLVMIDFARSRLRGDSESDEEWRQAKKNEDEEGAIGYIAQKEFGWKYVPSDKYRCPLEDAYWANFKIDMHRQK